MQPCSKTEFKAHLLQILRAIEQTGESRIITDHGNPVLEVRKLRSVKTPPLERLRGTVTYYSNPLDPVSSDDWDNA